MGKKISISDVIIKEVVKNPRVSDAHIAKIAEVSLRTVQRKRKLLEQNGDIKYYAQVNHYRKEDAQKGHAQMIIISLRKGITRLAFRQGFIQMQKRYWDQMSRHIRYSSLAERDGQVEWILTIESRRQEDLVEILNADIVRMLEEYLGQHCIEQLRSYVVTDYLQYHHNYAPDLNMGSSKMKDGWDGVFVR